MSNKKLLDIVKEFDSDECLNYEDIKIRVNEMNHLSKKEKKKLLKHYALIWCDDFLSNVLEYDEETAPVFEALYSIQGRLDEEVDNVEESKSEKDYSELQKKEPLAVNSTVN